MFRRLTTIAMCAVFIGALSLVPARANVDYTVRVTVPFQFMVGNTMLPAGRYEIYAVRWFSPQLLKIRNQDTLKSITVLSQDTIPVKGESMSPIIKDTRVVFDRVGDQYFLSQIWATGGFAANRIMMSPRERKLLKEYGGSPEEFSMRADVARSGAGS